MDKLTIAAIGDSIVKGDLGDTKQIGWVGRLLEKLKTQVSEVVVYNLGISGETVVKVSSRFSECLARDPDIVIISVGMNDMLKCSENHPRANKDQREKYWNQLLKQTAAVKGKVLVLNVTPVQKKLDPDPVLPTNKEIDSYNQQLADWCKDYNVELFDMNSVLKTFDLEVIYSDEVHPNDKGYEIISSIIERQIIKYL